MKFKTKIATFIAAAMLAVPVMASAYDYSVSENISFGAIGTDTAAATSIWGWGNDTANAGGFAGMTGDMSLSAASNYHVDVSGSFNGWGNVDANASAWDTGRTSGANASATGYGAASGQGTAYGMFGNDSASGQITFEGSLSQNTYAAETGYSAGGIDAAQGGLLNWESVDNMNYSNSWGRDYISDSHSGMANINGGSYVNIDPSGSFRSIEGNTYTNAYAPGNVDLTFGGGVGGSIQSYDGLGFAGGSAGYTVDTTDNYSHGNANLNAETYRSGSYTHTNVDASASAGGF